MEVKTIFFNLLDQRAFGMISKKISKMNGDVRVAFDIIKSAFVLLQNKVKYNSKDKHEMEEAK